MNTAHTPKIRAACYCRISSDPQDKRAGVTRQREDTAALCELKGWSAAGFYIDNDKSASSGKHRPEWDRLLADIKAGKIDAIAAWDQDRNWRLMYELETLRRFFTSLGRKIPLSTTGQGDIDLYSPTGVLAVQIKTAVSEHEVAMMRVRQRRAGRGRAETGRPKWRRAFGFLPYTGDKRDDDGTRQIDPATAPLVKEAYRVLLTGASLGDIAKIFNNAGAHGINGKPWTASTVSLFLRAPRNAGLREYGGEVIGKGTWPALVPESTWRAAQDKLNAPGRAPGRKSVRKHLLTGVLVCGLCDQRLGGNWVREATGGPNGHAIAYQCKGCHRVSIRAAHVEPLLYRLVGGRLAMPDAVDLLRAEVHDEAEAEAIRLELETLYGELENIGIERGQRLLTGQQAKAATDLINDDIAKLERRQQDAERLLVFDGLPLGRPEAADAVRQLSPDRFRTVLNTLATVTVAPVGKSGHVFNPDRVTVNWQH